MIAGFSLYVVRMMETIERQNGQLAALKSKLDRKEDILSLLASDNIEIVVMSGVDVNTPAHGKVVCDLENGTAILRVSHLPVPPQEKEYQLWCVSGTQAVSVLVFTVSDTADSFFKIDNLPFVNLREITAFTVTIEPGGGSATPTGIVHMSGSVQL